MTQGLGIFSAIYQLQRLAIRVDGAEWLLAANVVIGRHHCRKN